MKYPTDRDGKSKTASAVDEAHYPEQHEVEINGSEADTLPNHDLIAERAFQLWQAHGCPEGTAEQDWLQAEAELHAQAASQNRRGTAAGSVQA
jgi:hypothetical protein